MTPSPTRSKGQGSGKPRRLLISRLSQEELQIAALLYPERSYWRPKTRGDCQNVDRPCGYTTCRFNMYLDTNEKGSIIFNFPDVEPWDMDPKRSCALDMADHPRTLEEVGEAFNVTRERIRQIERIALLKFFQKAAFAKD